MKKLLGLSPILYMMYYFITEAVINSKRYRILTCYNFGYISLWILLLPRRLSHKNIKRGFLWVTFDDARGMDAF
jgi:hypothetical protein